MAKSKPNRRAKNKIGGASQELVISQDALTQANPFVDAEAAIRRVNVAPLERDSLFTAELVAVIDIIARDRVYRAMRDALKRRLLISPTSNDDLFDP